MRLRGRRIVGGFGEGIALVLKSPISFLEGVDSRGFIVDPETGLEGRRISGRVLVFPWCRGSTVGAYKIYSLSIMGLGPSAMVCREADIISATGCGIAGIPLVDRVQPDPLKTIRTGDHVKVYADLGLVEVSKRTLRPESPPRRS
ncbi:hypothetical protein DRO55_01995 [Candidatus Bathyarchaeota archaeon]|nr:MAG: hypothetical protein DRO55_01995 [Candidatus Bathyarchaeota archaeon]